jgi:hypothetical protein
VRDSTRWPAIVDEFVKQRSLAPRGTGGTLHSVGRGDIDSLHGRDGSRAATWYDEEHSVCWFLGFTQSHDYSLLTERALNDELLPDDQDMAIIRKKTEDQRFDERVGPGVRRLVTRAVGNPRIPARGTVGGLLRLTVAAVVERVGDRSLADVYVALRLPPLEKDVRRPPDWPGPELAERLAALATRGERDEILRVVTMPNGLSDRRVDPAKELAFVIRNSELADENPVKQTAGSASGSEVGRAPARFRGHTSNGLDAARSGRPDGPDRDPASRHERHVALPFGGLVNGPGSRRDGPAPTM